MFYILLMQTPLRRSVCISPRMAKGLCPFTYLRQECWEVSMCFCGVDHSHKLHLHRGFVHVSSQPVRQCCLSTASPTQRYLTVWTWPVFLFLNVFIWRLSCSTGDLCCIIWTLWLWHSGSGAVTHRLSCFESCGI